MAFTNEQRQWLQSQMKEYTQRVKGLLPGKGGSAFACARAEEFACQWKVLADGHPVSREDIIGKVTIWFALNFMDDLFAQEEEEKARMKKVDNRQLLDAELGRILQSYSNETDANFYLLYSLPPNEKSGPPVVSRLQCSSTRMSELPDFGTFGRREEERVFKKWNEYAVVSEKKRDLMSRVGHLITLDEHGYPKVPPVEIDLMKLGKPLTAYLEYSWYKLHETSLTILDIPWVKIKSNPSKYIDLSQLPPSLTRFQIPTNFLLEQISDLFVFLNLRTHLPFKDRFPFILQPDTRITGTSKQPPSATFQKQQTNKRPRGSEGDSAIAKTQKRRKRPTIDLVIERT